MTREEMRYKLNELRMMLNDGEHGEEQGVLVEIISELDRWEEIPIIPISALSENKDGWIPIEERKPNEYDDVLVSTDIEEVFEATYYGDELGFDDNNGNFYEGEVIAWQPKPKPYKENNTYGKQ